MFKNKQPIEAAGFFLNTNGKRLFGVFHYATNELGDAQEYPAIVCCAPIFEEKLHSHRILVNFARYAVSQGFHVLRFDYFGDGESEGLFEEASLSTRIDDIKSAIHIAKEKFGTSKVFLLGLRMGASLAILSSEIVKDDVCGLIAWAPITDLKTYVMGLLRANLSWQMVVHKKVIYDRNELARKILSGEAVNVEGYEIRKPLFEECLQVDLLGKMESLNLPTLMVAISASGDKSNEFKKLQQVSKNSNFKVVAVQEREFWKPQKIIYPGCTGLFATTISWLIRLF